eukprot:872155-Amphidinium_carterae.1
MTLATPVCDVCGKLTKATLAWMLKFVIPGVQSTRGVCCILARFAGRGVNMMKRFAMIWKGSGG